MFFNFCGNTGTVIYHVNLDGQLVMPLTDCTTASDPGTDQDFSGITDRL